MITSLMAGCDQTDGEGEQSGCEQRPQHAQSANSADVGMAKYRAAEHCSAQA